MQEDECGTVDADPDEVSVSKISYSEQCQLYRWVKAQMHKDTSLDTAFLPSVDTMDTWDRNWSKQISQLSRDVHRQQKKTERKPPGPRPCLADAWGFPGKRGRKAGYSLETLRSNVLACNKAFYEQLQEPRAEVDLHKVIIFPHHYGMTWNRQLENKSAVLCHALSTKPGPLQAQA